MIEPKFTNYKDAKPSAGIVTWKTEIEGLEVLFNAEMRMRGAGYERVLSPQFDYWDGYYLHVNHDVSWSNEFIDIKYNSIRLVRDINVCPICKSKPTIKHNRTNPMEADYFYIECCNWIDGVKNRDESLKSLIQDWNGLSRSEA